MFLPTVPPSLPVAESDLIRSGSSADPSGSGVGSKHEALRSPSAGAEWSEEQDRILAARYRSLDNPRFPDCHPYCCGSVHVLTCPNKRPRRDDDWQRRSEYEEGIRE